MGKWLYLIREWLESKSPPLIKREFDLDYLATPSTSLLYQISDHLRQKIPSAEVIYANFENDRIYPLQGNEVSNLWKTYQENFAASKEIWLLLDEIQVLDGWERTVRRLHEKKEARLILTGSSSSLLPEEIATTLRGRTLTSVLYPLSFREFLKAKEFNVRDIEGIFYSPKRQRLLNLFQEYLRYGGFPEVVFEEKKKDELLREYYRAIFYRDILERFLIKNTHLFEAFLKLLIDQNASLFSITKTYNYLRTIGYRLNKSTLSEYLVYCKYPYLTFEVEIFSYKMKDRLQYPRKIYTIDPGLVNALMFGPNLSYAKMLETAVFIELTRRGKEVYYWKGSRGYEVDFVVKDKEIHLIQVAWEIDEGVKKGEERALLKAMEEFGIKEGLIITRDHKEEKAIEDKKILYLPAWWWLLESEKI